MHVYVCVWESFYQCLSYQEIIRWNELIYLRPIKTEIIAKSLITSSGGNLEIMYSFQKFLSLKSNSSVFHSLSL